MARQDPLDKFPEIRIKRGPTGKWIIYPKLAEGAVYKTSDLKTIAQLLNRIGADLEDGFADDVIVKWQ